MAYGLVQLVGLQAYLNYQAVETLPISSQGRNRIMQKEDHEDPAVISPLVIFIRGSIVSKA